VVRAILALASAMSGMGAHAAGPPSIEDFARRPLSGTIMETSLEEKFFLIRSVSDIAAPSSRC
jgi:hypothetical protein